MSAAQLIDTNGKRATLKSKLRMEASKVICSVDVERELMTSASGKGSKDYPPFQGQPGRQSQGYTDRPCLGKQKLNQKRTGCFKETPPKTKTMKQTPNIEITEA